MRVLDLRDNQIKEIDNIRISELPKIQYLILQRNKLEDVFPSLAHFPDLLHLRLRENQISFIEGFKHNNLLEILVSFNKLKSIPRIYCETLQDMSLI